MQLSTKSGFSRLLLLIGVTFFMSQGLRAQQVQYNFMPGTDFSKYHTYKWVEIPGGIHPNQIIDQEIKQAVNNTLASKGLTLATGDTADVYVAHAAHSLPPLPQAYLARLCGTNPESERQSAERHGEVE
jgi:Domain of unknown function (DUF4136)